MITKYQLEIGNNYVRNIISYIEPNCTYIKLSIAEIANIEFPSKNTKFSSQLKYLRFALPNNSQKWNTS